MTSFDHVCLLLTPDAVRWREDTNQLLTETLGEQIARKVIRPVDRGLVHQQADPRVAQAFGGSGHTLLKSDLHRIAFWVSSR